MEKKKKTPADIETIDEMLERYGLADSEFVRGIRNRYSMQLNIINRLNEQIAKDGVTVEKKRDGVYNLYAHPCVTELKSHIAVANNTALTLTKIIADLGKLEDAEEKTKPKKNAIAEILGSV